MTKPNRRNLRQLDSLALRAIAGGETAVRQNETLASSIMKKLDEANSGTISKI